MNYKSPFLVYQEFLSPLLCEEIVDHLDVTVPDRDIDGKPLPSFRHNDYCEKVIFERIESHLPRIMSYYDIEYRGTERMIFEWYPEESYGKPHCDSSEYLRKKWVKTKDRDITGILFLSDHREQVPFDPEYEVCGGKLEFPQHQFGFNPERGTLILYPSTPHFINATSQVEAGDLFQVRFHIATKTPLIYQPKNFPGNYRVWFQNLLG